MVWGVRHTDGRLYLNYDATAAGSVNVSPTVQVERNQAANFGNGGIGMLVAWHQTVFDADKTKVYNDAFKPWAGDSAVDRISKLLGVVAPGVPLVQGPSSTGAILPVTFASRSPLVVIGNMMVDHADRFFATRDGTLKVVTADNLPAVLRTYGEGGVPIRRLAMRDQAQAFTSVRYKNEAGNEVVVGDPTTGAEHTFSGSAGKAQFLKGNANRLLNAAAAEAKPAVSEIELTTNDPNVDPVETLTLDLYDRVNAARRSPWDGAVVTQLREICRIRHHGTPDKGSTTTVRFRTPVD